MCLRYKANRILIFFQTTQHIASYLEYDSDVCNFRLICRSTLDAVEGDKFTFWRRRFLTCFETPRWPPSGNILYRDAYQKRRRLLKNGAAFTTGESQREIDCLELLKSLAVGE